MIQHIALVRWKPESTREQRVAAIGRVRALPDEIEEIQSYSVQENVGGDPANFDVAIVATFADLDAYVTYRDHPAHRKVMKEATLPILEQRAGVQLTIP
jgi:Stress responsive A/B Barrel Domain